MRPFDRPGRSPVHARRGMVATSHPASTDVGLDVLKAGGNALDAAIAACAMQCVVEPGMTGIGGDCFAMLLPGGRGTPIAYNGSGRAPAGATLEALAGVGIDARNPILRDSPHSVVVPGAIDAWTTLHADHGRAPFAELLAPAIAAARDGAPLHSRVAFDMHRQRDFLAASGRCGEIHLEDGEVPAVGSLRRQPALADALEAIAREGRAPMYDGHLARDTVDELSARGGFHVMADFESARGEYVEPISAGFRGRTVWECPPNGQGLIALLLLRMFERLPPGTGDPLSPERMHLEIEACRLAYAVRDERLADPAHAHVPVGEILSDAHVDALLARIDPARASHPPTTVPLPAHEDTVYISVVDGDRDACSFINTLFHAFGSGIATGSGIVLTNRAQGFSLDPASPNVVAPGKRPRHTIIPALATAGSALELCFGVMGGEYQAMGHLQFLTRHLDYGLDLQEAMDAPRFMVDPSTGEVEVESGVCAGTRAALGAMGHRVVDAESPVGGSQAVSVGEGGAVLTGASDPRKDGAAAGY